MKKLLFAAFLALLLQNTYGQKYKFCLNAGYGVYQMHDLKELQSYMATYYAALNIKEVQQFPGYINYSGSFEYFLNSQNLLGLNVAYYTTGGRNHVSDYSGEYILDMPVNAYHIGLQYRNIMETFGKISLYARLNGGITLSTLDVKESFVIYYADSTSSSYSFGSKSFSAEPGFGALYSLKNNLSVDFSLGYQIDIKSKLHPVESKKDDMTGPSGNPVYINWSGLRLMLGINYDLFKQ